RLRLGASVLAVACLFAIAIPMATVSTVRQSQAAVSSGDPALALADARAAVNLQPGAASAQIQLALVLEQQGRLVKAPTAARAASRDEPDNWSAWLVVSRLEAEAGHPSASVAAYRRSRSLNPRSPLFAQLTTNRPSPTTSKEPNTTLRTRSRSRRPGPPLGSA